MLRGIFHHVVAFSSTELFPTIAKRVLEDIWQYLYLYNRPLDQHQWGRFLNTGSNEIGSHSDIVHLSSDRCTRFRWINDLRRPLGHFAPTIQCPKCLKSGAWDKGRDGYLPLNWHKRGTYRDIVCRRCHERFTYHPLGQLLMADQTALVGWNPVPGTDRWIMHNLSSTLFPAANSEPAANLVAPVESVTYQRSGQFQALTPAYAASQQRLVFSSSHLLTYSSIAVQKSTGHL